LVEREKLLEADCDDVGGTGLARQESRDFECGSKPVDKVLRYAAETLEGRIIRGNLYE